MPIIRDSKQAANVRGKQEYADRTASGWNAVEEVAPDAVDLQMLQDARADPDCRAFASEEEVANLFR